MKRLIIVLAMACLATTVTYSQSCVGPLSVTIEGSTAGTPLDGSGVETDSECNNGSGPLSGSIDLTVTGGSLPYLFSWDNGATTEDLSALGAGTYDVTVTDDQGCTMAFSFEIEEPDPVAVTGVETDLECNSLSGAPTGAINLSVTGGTGAYSYLWSNGATTEDISGLAAGTYDVVVTDANGCTDGATFTLDEPTAVEIVANPGPLSCNSANGSADATIDLTISGGTAPYTYNWSNGETTEDIAGLAAGTYDVTVTDANDCTAEGSWTIDDVDPIEVLASATDLSCNALSGAPDGDIDITVSGGTAPYTFSWSNGANTEDITGLTAGTYTIDIQDANGCQFQATYTLSQPAAVAASGEITEPGCAAVSGLPTGAIDLSVVGGTGAYTYLWSNGATTQDLADLAEGTYTVVVTDANDCTDTQTFTLTEPDAVTCSLDSPILGTCGDNILCNGGTGTINVTAAGGTPGAGYQYSLDGGAFQSSATFTTTAGTHTVTVQDANGCTSTCDITLTEPDAIIAGTCVENDECQVNAGEIQVQADGGCAPYTITWTASNGATLDQASQTINTAGGTVTFTGATGGETYTFTLTDANGCIIGG
jgi:hypothetical protein